MSTNSQPISNKVRLVNRLMDAIKKEIARQHEENTVIKDDGESGLYNSLSNERLVEYVAEADDVLKAMDQLIGHFVDQMKEDLDYEAIDALIQQAAYERTVELEWRHAKGL